MEQVTIRFDRVFDLHRIKSTRHIPRHTLFSFQAAGKCTYSISVPGWPEIKADLTVTALLRKPGNWQTLVGWVNHASGEIAEERAPYPFLPAFTSACVCGIWGAGLFVCERTGARILLGLLVSFCFVWSALLWQQAIRKKHEAKAMTALASSILS
jgi:hypothetical protein